MLIQNMVGLIPIAAIVLVGLYIVYDFIKD